SITKGEVEFKNVWFAYKDEAWVMKDLSLQVNTGETIALVGATGSGKTSIISLLNRLYEYQQGSVLIDGVEINQIPPDQLRKHIAVVLQEVFLFPGSIIENVTLRNDHIQESEVIAVAKMLGLHDWIQSLPGGYHFNVLERGNALSQGQRQLLSFMRALLFNPTILVLDEATSSVDTETEQLIQHAIDTLIKGRTSIVIAHRLSTIRRADKILVLDKGEIVESGTHATRMNLKGRYAKLYALQFSEEYVS
ncbi:MAG: ABC transporter ATP-binding protein, partial [Bacteroidota bacterium]